MWQHWINDMGFQIIPNNEHTHTHTHTHLLYAYVYILYTIYLKSGINKTILILLYYCHSLSSSAFVSSPLYGPSCFPVIISSVSVSLVLIMSQVSPVMSPYISLFYPMLPVDYC